MILNENKFLLTVCLITYNHKNYIQNCLESILAQKTDFNFNIIIADDFSTDGTREILNEYKNKFPEKITLLPRDKNIGAVHNWLELINTPNSRYIAYIEGDDYWLSDNKLQLQVNFLNSNPEYAICGHWHINVDKNDVPINSINWEGKNCPETFNIEDAITGVLIHPNTWVYKNDRINFHEIIYELPMGDDPFLLLILKNGKGYCFKETLSSYRHHDGGTWSTKKQFQKNIEQIYFMTVVHLFIGIEYTPTIKVKLKNLITDLTYKLIHSESYINSNILLVKSFFNIKIAKYILLKIYFIYQYSYFQHKASKLISRLK